MVKLARNEQCITLYPLTAHYSVGPFPAHVIFWPSQGPFILGLISSFRLLTACYCHFLLVNTLGRFHSIIKYGQLTTAHYSIGTFPAHVIFRPYQGPFILGLISSIWLLTTRYYHFLLVGQIQLVVTVGPFVAH